MRRFPPILALIVASLSMLSASHPAGASRSTAIHRSNALAAPERTTSGTSDFNGDGFPDLAIGVPHDDTEDASDAGAVNVMYGSLVGIQVNTPPDQRWSQSSLDIKGIAAAGDGFGSAIAAGDFNQDGFADMAVGTPGDSVNDLADAGVVNVLYGSSAGLEAETPIDDQLWTQEATGVSDQAEKGDGFGGALSSGDFNGDGFDDLAIGVSGETVGSVDKAGAVSVLYGSAAGLQADAPDDQFWNQNSEGVRGKTENLDQFGWALAAGDFNADGIDDLSIGVYGQDVSQLDKAGAVAILYGSVARLQATSPDDQVWNRDSSNVQEVADAFDHLGAALAAGDFNGDGFDDLAMGAFGDDVGTPEILNAGSVNVLYGSGSGLQATAPDDQVWTQNSKNVEDKAEKDDHMGDSVAAADFNGDGFDDLAIGVPLENVDAVVDGGSVNLLYGGASRLQTGNPTDQLWSQNTDDVTGDAETGDKFGTGVTGSDFNGDGFDDLVAGVPGAAVGAADGAGAISGLYGSAGGVQATNPDDVRKTQGSIGVEGDPEAGDGFGAAVLGS
jgi:hypothetical protein